MKGIVFTEFLDHVEGAFGPEVVEDMIEASDLPNGGAYTAVGTYDHAEIARLMANLSKLSGVAAADLLHGFGHFLGGRFADKFGHFFDAAPSLFDLLESVDEHIHVEVRKLYPDADLPSIVMTDRDEATARLRYRSPRHMEPLAVGLIEASAGYYGDRVTVACEAGSDEQGSYTDLVVSRE